jgi:hypothetical protein
MPAGLPVALMLLAQATAAPEATSAAPAGPPAATPVNKPCESTRPTADSDEIVVCVERMEGYRIDPDIMAAKRGVREQGNRPKPRERLKGAPGLCENIGGCQGMEGVNLVGVGLAAARLAARAAQGESLRDMFVTDPQMSEYELYQEAKRQREEREAGDEVKAFMREHKAQKAGHAPPPAGEQ